jgi:hypothetical protein
MGENSRSEALKGQSTHHRRSLVTRMPGFPAPVVECWDGSGRVNVRAFSSDFSTSAYRARPWVRSGWECRVQGLSRARGSLGRQCEPCRYHWRERRHVRGINDSPIWYARTAFRYKLYFPEAHDQLCLFAHSVYRAQVGLRRESVAQFSVESCREHRSGP